MYLTLALPQSLYGIKQIEHKTITDVLLSIHDRPYDSGTFHHNSHKVVSTSM